MQFCPINKGYFKKWKKLTVDKIQVFVDNNNEDWRSAMESKDLEIIEQAKNKNAAAFQTLYQNYYRLVFYYAWNICKNEADARDVTQDVFLQVYRSISDLRDSTLFVPWLRKITMSKCQRLFKKNKDTLYDEEQISKELGKEKRKEFIPHEYIDHLSDKEILEGLLLQLTDRRRIVLEMFYLQQMSMEEIANEMDINISTVKGRLHEARKAFHKVVRDFERTEGRKISFQMEGITSSAIIVLLAKWKSMFVQNMWMNLMEVSMAVVCGVVGVSAFKESMQVNQDKVVQTNDEKQNDEKIIDFHPIQYHDKMISNTNDAYFVILDFAYTQDLLKTKDRKELLEIQPLVNELCRSDNAYKDILSENGWLNVYQALL